MDNGWPCLVCTKIGDYIKYIKSTLISSYYGFNVFFDNPVAIERGVRYHLDASIPGSANPWFGHNGQPSVVCSGVIFDFRRVITVVMGRQLNKDNFQVYFLL